MPRQLPPNVADFTGRELALEWLHARMRARERGSTAVVITAAVGKAGWENHVGRPCRSPDAHAISRWSVVRQLARGRGAGPQPRRCARRVSARPRCGGQSIPDDVDERADLYRSLMADRHALVLLDNAADEAQVRPLLPAGAGNAVLVTSRTRLTGLAGTEVIDLEVLPPEQAVELLGKIAGEDRIAKEPAAALSRHTL